MLYLCHEPSFPYGIFSAKYADAFASCGISAVCDSIGSDWVAHFLRRILPRRKWQAGSALLNTVFLAKRLVDKIQSEDIVVVYETAGILSPYADCAFHRAVKLKGAKVVSVIPDAWPITFPAHQKACALRASLVDLMLGVTPALVRLLGASYPDVVCDLFEEPIDTDAFYPCFEPCVGLPVVVWSGPPEKLSEIEKSRSILEAANRVHPFRLRVVTGTKRPALSIDVPYEWIPFSQTIYSEQFQGADIAFARYTNYNPEYAECKGNYKVKTYMAAGCATITDSVGYNNELISSGISGVLAGTEEDWIDGLSRLLTNPDYRQGVRQTARKFAIERFSYVASAKQLIRILEQYFPNEMRVCRNQI